LAVNSGFETLFAPHAGATINLVMSIIEPRHPKTEGADMQEKNNASPGLAFREPAGEGGHDRPHNGTAIRPRTAATRFWASVAGFGASVALITTMCVPANAASASPSPAADVRAVMFQPIVARHSGRCLDVDGSSTEPNTQVVQRACDGSASQRWTFVPVEWGANRFFLVNQNSGQCLDVAGGSQQPGGIVIQWLCNGGPAQQFVHNLVPAGAGYFTLTAVHSNQCVEVGGGSFANGAPVVQGPCNSAPNQQWRN
jgi:hypothetical protein